jgi:hypothetical protein
MVQGEEFRGETCTAIYAAVPVPRQDPFPLPRFARFRPPLRCRPPVHGVWYTGPAEMLRQARDFDPRVSERPDRPRAQAWAGTTDRRLPDPAPDCPGRGGGRTLPAMLEDLRLERLRRAFGARPARGVPRVGAAEAGVALVVRPRDALEIDQLVYGPDHPTVATRMANLSIVVSAGNPAHAGCVA